MIKKKILIVGANSFLSKELIAKLHPENEITGIYNNQKDNLSHNIEYLHVSQLDKLNREYDVIFIISAYVPGGINIDHELLKKVNIGLMEKICSKFKDARIVFTSSVSVYGEVEGIISEDTRPVNPAEYGNSKLDAEEIIKMTSSYSILRIASMYGVGMKTSTFIPRIISSALSKKEIILFGNGSRQQNYIHVSDVAEMLIHAAGQNSNNSYLGVADRSYSNLEIAQMVKEIIKDAKITFTGEDLSASFVYNGTYTYNALDYIPQKNINKGILELIQWQQKQYS